MSPARPSRIVVLGEALIDLLVAPNGTVVARPGGGPFNAARTIGRLGGDVAFVGALSSDRFGGLLRRSLADARVDVSRCARTEAPTTLAVAETDDVGSATYRFYLDGTSMLVVDDALVAAAVHDARVLHVGTLGLVLEPSATAVRAAVAAAGDGVLVFCDPNCRRAVVPDAADSLRRIAPVLARADIVKLSIDDLEFLSPGPVDEAVGALVDTRRQVALVSAGADAVEAFGPFGSLVVDVPRVHIVDTVGAGDALGAAFVHRWVDAGRGRAELADAGAVAEALHFAVQVASATCTRAGAEPPTADEMRGR